MKIKIIAIFPSKSSIKEDQIKIAAEVEKKKTNCTILANNLRELNKINEHAQPSKHVSG
jgi:hypothetical protein